MSFLVLLLTLALYVIRPGDWIPGLDIRWNLILNGIGLIAAIGLAMAGKMAASANRVWAYFFMFWVLMMASSVANGQFSTIGVYTPQMLTNILVFVLVCSTVDSKRKFQFLIGIFVALTLFVAYQCHLQIETGANITGEGPIMRGNTLTHEDGTVEIIKTPQAVWVGVFHDPNDVGLLLTTFFPLAFAKTFFMSGPAPIRLCWAAIGAALLYSIYLADSRGTFLATMAGVVFFFIVWRRSVTGLVIATISGFLMLTLGPSRMSSLTSGDDSAMERVYAWIEALETFAWKPMFGLGPEHWIDYHHKTTHNSFVLAFVENGYFAYVCWLAVLLVPLHTVVNTSLKTQDRNHRIEASAMAACLIGVMTSIFFISRTYILIPVLIAAICMTYSRLQNVGAYREALQRSTFVPLCLVAAVTIVGIWVINRLTTMFML